MAAEKKRRYDRLIFILVVQVLFIIANPNPKMHLDYIRGTIINEIDTGSAPLGSNLINLFEAAIGQDAINNYLNMHFKRTSYLFFSVTEKQVKGNWEIMAIGVLGNIIAWDDMKNGWDRIMIKLDL